MLGMDVEVGDLSAEVVILYVVEGGEAFQRFGLLEIFCHHRMVSGRELWMTSSCSTQMHL